MANIKDLKGSKVGLLTLLDRKRENNRTYYFCKCDCGNEKWIRADSIGNDCGCKRKYKFKDLTNKKFGRLTALKVISSSKNNGNIWRCKCDCGNYKDIPISNLISGAVVSCGCYKKEVLNKNIEKVFEEFKSKNLVENTNVSYLQLDKPIKSNKSGVTGVSFNQRSQRWVATIRFKKKTYYLGAYKNKEDAIKAREEAEENLHKKFLREKGILKD